MRNSSRFIILCFSFLAVPRGAWAEDPPPAAPAEAAPAETSLEPGADYICEVDIFYTWKPTPPPKAVPPVPASKNTAAGDAAGENETPENIREFFTTAGEQGVVKEEIINRLTSKIPFYERQAADQCKSIHQDQTLCVSSRLRASFEQYNKLDYSTRKAVVDGIQADCSAKLGRCLDTEASETRCSVNRSPEVPAKPPATAEAETGATPKEKDKKKK